MDKTLLILAAGMGSRYGGDKQIDGMGPHNEILLEYSIYDALKAGFTKIVFIIKRDFEKRFREIIGDRLEKQAKVVYVFQDFENAIPDGCVIPPERTKPLGTVHAMLCAADAIDEPFAVLNADDYYGRPAFALMLDQLGKLAPEREGCMVGYYLRNTISENGHVTRGICALNDVGRLVSVTETYKIQPFPDGTIRDTEKDPAGILLDPDCLVSMNFFGFTPWIFSEAKRYFKRFLEKQPAGELKKEYVLPVMVDELMHGEGLTVDVLTTDSTWFGVTYQQDKPYVQRRLIEMHAEGMYPDQLF